MVDGRGGSVRGWGGLLGCACFAWCLNGFKRLFEPTRFAQSTIKRKHKTQHLPDDPRARKTGAHCCCGGQIVRLARN